MKKKLLLCFTLMGLGLAGCARDIPIEDLVLSIPDGKATLTLGEEVSLTTAVTPLDTTDVIAWSSSDETVVTVDETGKVSAVGLGTAVITASAGELSKSVTLTVNPSVTSVVAALKGDLAVEGTLTYTETLVGDSSDPTEIISNMKVVVYGDQYSLVEAEAESGYIYQELHLFEDEDGDIRIKALSYENEVLESDKLTSSSGEAIVFDELLANPFREITEADVSIVSPTSLLLTFEESTDEVVSVAYEEVMPIFSGYSGEITSVEIGLNKNGSLATMKMADVQEYEDDDGTLYELSNALDLRFTTREALNLAVEPQELTAEHDALVDAFEAINKGNFTAKMVDHDTAEYEDESERYPDYVYTLEASGTHLVIGSGEDDVIEDDAVYFEEEDGVHSASVVIGEDEEVTIEEMAASLPGATLEDVTPKIDIAPALFKPAGDGKYVLPAYPVANSYGEDYVVYTTLDYFFNNSLVMFATAGSLEIEVVGSPVESVVMTYDYYIYGLTGTITTTFTNIGTTTYKYADAKFVDYVPPTKWSDVSAEWAAATKLVMGEDFNADELPFVGVHTLGLSWSLEVPTADDTYIYMEVSVQDADDLAAVEKMYQDALTAAGWTTDGSTNSYGETIYTHTTHEYTITIYADDSCLDHLGIGFFDVYVYPPVEEPETGGLTTTTWAAIDTTYGTSIATTLGELAEVLPAVDFGVAWKTYGGLDLYQLTLVCYSTDTVSVDGAAYSALCDTAFAAAGWTKDAEGNWSNGSYLIYAGDSGSSGVTVMIIPVPAE